MVILDWSKIRADYEQNGLTPTELAKKYNMSAGTIRSRKSREGWDGSNQRNATKNKTVATKKGNVATSKPKKKSGNPNPPNQFTERNQAARKHGLFSRYMPKETLEIIKVMGSADPADLLWDQIMIQYAAIYRSQRIMHVEDKNEMIKEVKKKKIYTSDREDIDEFEYEFQFSWDRQATFLNAQSKAMSELRASIKQFLEISDENDERRLKLDSMRVDLDRKREEVKQLKGVDSGTTTVIVNNEDEMRKRLKERESKTHGES